MNDKYILKGHVAVPCHDLLQWGRWFEEADRSVAKDTVGDVRVSTVFLGLDHSFGSGPPLLFETMIFGGKHDQYQRRYEDWDSAMLGHQEALALAQGSGMGVA